MTNDSQLTSDELKQLRTQCDRLIEGQYEGALQVLAPLAERGAETAMLYLGWMYRHGSGVKANEAKAGEWFRRASEGGSPDALYQLAKFLISTGDQIGGVRCLEQAVGTNHMPAQYELGVLLLLSKNERDQQRGWELLKLAAQQGHVFAKRKLAPAMLKGKFGILGIPLGVWMFITAFSVALHAGLTDPTSDKLR